ncbi:MAG TPA: YraN family protein [Patescibacteria group bacterium]|nr:YraN family protein [Patescibacteria group bacterium]
MNTKEKGRLGERLAEDYLQKNNYKIREKNYYTRWGEIDIVAEDEGSGEVVFVEVKMRNSNTCGYPEEAVDERKVEKMALAAENYLEKKEEQCDYRFDCLAIVGDLASRKATIKHYKNIGLS